MGSTNHPQMVGLYIIELPTVCHFCSTKSGQVGISEGFPGHIGHICDHLWILLCQPAVHRQCGTRLRLFMGTLVLWNFVNVAWAGTKATGHY